MPEYRRAYQPGGTFFLTLVTHHRRPLFDDPARVTLLRTALRATLAHRAFEVYGAVVLPDHLHFLWTLPPGDADFSTRVGTMKAAFTKLLSAAAGLAEAASPSRRRRRERDVWQRRFWEHTIRDEGDLEAHMDYIHYNPVKHGLVRCPHEWPWSSFAHWVGAGRYDASWMCTCHTSRPPPDFAAIARSAGE